MDKGGAVKYRSKPCELNGQKYRSQREMKRHQELMVLESVGAIIGLQREVPFELAPKVKIEGEKRTRPAIRYYCDFRYTTKAGKVVHEDAKGMQTAVYRLKKHLLATVHGIHVIES